MCEAVGGGCKAEGGCVKTEGKERSVWQLQEEEIGLWNSGKKEEGRVSQWNGRKGRGISQQNSIRETDLWNSEKKGKRAISQWNSRKR